MKIKLQDLVRQCEGKECWTCKLEKDMHCTATIGGLVPTAYADFVRLCERYPEQAKALYTNDEIEI